MMLLMRKALFFALVATLLACSSAPAQQGTDTAARIGDRTITVKELDDRWRADDPAAHAEATQKLYEGRRAALRGMAQGLPAGLVERDRRLASYLDAALRA